MIKAIATDLDGTLLYPRRPIRLVSSSNVQDLRSFSDNGGKIILVSGRGPLFCHQVAQKIDLPCTIIACSGAYIEHDDQIISEKLIPNSIVLEIEELLEKNRKCYALVVTTDDYRLLSKLCGANIVYKALSRLYKLKNGKYNENIVVKNHIYDAAIKRKDCGVLKIVLYLSDFIKGERYQFAELIKEHVSFPLNISITRTGLEITPDLCDKGSALEKVAQHLALDKQEIAVVGDDGNDVPMFQKFPHSFIMSHGYTGAKKEARYEIENFKELLKTINEINSVDN